jgi:hypothetical protein
MGITWNLAYQKTDIIWFPLGFCNKRTQTSSNKLIKDDHVKESIILSFHCYASNFSNIFHTFIFYSLKISYIQLLPTLNHADVLSSFPNPI